MAKTNTTTRKPALRNGPSIPPDRDRTSTRHGRLPYYEPLRNLKAKEIEDVLRVEANKGLFARPTWTFHEMAKVCSLVGDKVRFWKAKIAAMEWRIEVAADAQGDDADPEKAQRAEAQREVLQRRYERIRNLKTALKHLATARFYGFAVLRVGEAELAVVDPWNVIHDIQWLTEAEPTYGWFFNKRAESQLWRDKMPRMEGGGAGYVIRESDDASMVELMRLGLRAMRIMDFREKDLEAAARRQVVALTGGNLPDEGEERKNLMDALKAVRDGESAVVAKGDPACPTEVVFAPASRGLMYYNESLTQIDEAMTKAVTGGMLTMLAMPTGIGSGASAEHAETLAGLVADEASGIMEALWRDVDEPTLRAAGLLADGELPLAWFEIGGAEKKDPAAAADVLVKLKQAGKQVDDGIASEMLGFEVTAAPEPDPAAAGGGFGGFGNDAKAFAAALRNRSGEYLERKRAVRLDGKFFDFLENLANKYGGKAEADEEWLDQIAGMIEEAPPESFVDSAALESWIEARMRRGEREALANTRDANGMLHGDHDGRFEKDGGGKARAREPETKGQRDNYGTTNEEKLVADPDENMRRGLSVVTHLMGQKAGFEPKAMFRRDTDWIGIDYGEPGNKNNAWKGGHGLSHILAKHPGAEKHLVDVLQNGDAYKHHKSERKVTLVKDRTVVVLSKHRTGRLLITDYENATDKQIAEYTARGKYHVKGEN